MTVHAGSIILEPGLTGNDLGEVAKKGVWLAKAGFGAFSSAYEYGSLIAAARAHDMITTVHTGGSSIPGSGAITGDHLLALKPNVSFHINAAQPPCRMKISSGSSARVTLLYSSARPGICARHYSAPGWHNSSKLSIGSSSPPIPQLEAA
jgi:hypothetical protein